MNKYRIRINNEKLSRTISADSFMNDGGGGITFYKINNGGTFKKSTSALQG